MLVQCEAHIKHQVRVSCHCYQFHDDVDDDKNNTSDDGDHDDGGGRSNGGDGCREKTLSDA